LSSRGAHETHRSATAERPAAADSDLTIIAQHRAAWHAKPELAPIYEAWFDRMLAAIPPNERVLEVGAGAGFLAAHAREMRPDLAWIASDYLLVHDNDLVADAMRLPFDDGTVGAVAGFDVLHHLAQPAAFLREAARVLRPAGTLILVEPWLSPLAYPLYALFHHEVCHPWVDPWRPFGTDASAAKAALEGNSAVPWKLLRVANGRAWSDLGLLPPEVERLNGFAYLLSLGFHARSLLPSALLWPLLWFDRWSGWAAAGLAIRARLRWQKLS
jgi:SAM-dependent methyltransferase